ncbi:aromatic ring-hydroxylating dioxygenase subunit alpha [Sphingobium sp. AR-3-1]|uniref:Aromatic ring-hydroxylating dioxygenase subunit alpha n=1 Tax=Sphingobium psychrophilum TaxID=2728834 RepID=A0A7X9X0E7_9SPHN|nr:MULTISPECIES: aromatic ring-hydroxylating dioxygenase subunit alpha [Sphingobium]NML13266.1 aromatic ring-hydroxylating dioxygenase subunit alpha [Sphingobium psychrophilum]
MLGIPNLVDNVASNQSREIFWDKDVYNLELERIFARSWLFLGHESLLPKPGDFITTYMAEDKVILSHQQDGSFRAFINSCTHRGNQICHADSGNAKAFVCNYHGWVYGQDGSLVDVPLETRCYHGQLDKAKLGAKHIRVETYKGFIFGCGDADAPSLEEYLGEFRWYLDTIWEGAGGGLELLGPPMKSILACNWKVPAENFVGDGYHVGWTHAGALMQVGGELAGLAGNRADMPFEKLGFQFTTRHGHGFGVINNAAPAIHVKRDGWAKYLADTRAEVGRKFGPEREELYVGHWNCSLFPSCSFLYGTNTFKVWHPRGPHEIEVWTYTMVPRDADAETKSMIQREATRSFGTAGTLESDDGENMSSSTFVNRGTITRNGRISSSMGVGFEGPHPVFPGIVGSSFIGETSHRGFYRFWKEMLDAPDWKAVKANDDTWDSMFTNRNYWNDKVDAAE